MTQNREYLFKEGERILCYHGPMIYEAKVLQFDTFDTKHPKSGLTGPHYLIHYKGWKNTWDEWVEEPRVLKFNEANLNKQKMIEETMNKKNKPSVKKTVQDPNIDKGKKRRRDRSIDKDDLVKRPKIIFNMPEPLRALLVQDWENINKSHMNVPLPRKPHVGDIIENYRRWRKENNGNQDSLDGIAEEVLKGVLFYFNKCIGTRLLYQLERPQYREVRHKLDHYENSQIFGAEHLLRLFVAFPQLVSSTNLGQETLNVLKDHLTDLINYLNEHRKEYFLEEYVKLQS
ncbi:3009_t:CDS:2 [Acaulospora morrowiae]|uniref:Chromatin modification-related protein EAF3 n=1 Tax=Acaulospora morrowiae TaxID=94023 RepID=A0A9N9ADM2_9GLOM|nr:3009_t:CDS:2 [Acaulospora morrowiae]